MTWMFILYSPVVRFKIWNPDLLGANADPTRQTISVCIPTQAGINPFLRKYKDASIYNAKAKDTQTQRTFMLQENKTRNLCNLLHARTKWLQQLWNWTDYSDENQKTFLIWWAIWFNFRLLPSNLCFNYTNIHVHMYFNKCLVHNLRKKFRTSVIYLINLAWYERILGSCITSQLFLIATHKSARNYAPTQ